MPQERKRSSGKDLHSRETGSLEIFACEGALGSSAQAAKSAPAELDLFACKMHASECEACLHAWPEIACHARLNSSMCYSNNSDNLQHNVGMMGYHQQCAC